MLSIMKNKKILCSVCFLFAFVSVLWGQNITVKGNVTSKTDGQPIIGASRGAKRFEINRDYYRLGR